jgi:hypothetical protein
LFSLSFGNRDENKTRGKKEKEKESGMESKQYRIEFLIKCGSKIQPFLPFSSSNEKKKKIQGQSATVELHPHFWSNHTHFLAGGLLFYNSFPTIDGTSRNDRKKKPNLKFKEPTYCTLPSIHRNPAFVFICWFFSNPEPNHFILLSVS